MAFRTQPVGAYTHLRAGEPITEELRRVCVSEKGKGRGKDEECTCVREREKTRKSIFHLGTVRLWLS